jgi:hypothetical protein
LLRHAAGDPLALREGFIESCTAYLSAGPSLYVMDTGARFELRARVAALVDFFLATPQVVPPPAR